jgi:hypothetical protein
MMSLPSHLPIDSDSSHFRYRFTDQQLIQAQMLSPETAAYFQHMATDFLELLGTIEFSGTPAEQEAQMRNHAFVSGRRKLLLELLAESDNAWQQVAAHTPA